MTQRDRINSAVDTWAVEFSNFLACPRGDDRECIGVPAVAVATNVSTDTIRNYANGRTFPDIRWLATFSEKYRRDYPADVGKLWRCFEVVAGGRFGPAAEFDKDFLDANRDGVVDGRDGPIHRAEAVAAAALNLVEADGKDARDHATTMRIAAAGVCEERAVAP